MKPWTLLMAVVIGLAPSQGQDSQPFHCRMPPQWRFSDAEAGPPAKIEEALGKILADPESTERESAAFLLWRNRSFIHAKAVIELAETTRGALAAEVTAGLKPETIRREVESADPRWGFWLAYLRPQAELVDILMEKTRGSFQTGAVLALGRSRDPRALGPLLALLRDSKTPLRGFTACALRDFGSVDAEADLIAALSESDDLWLQVNACDALAKIGTERALPALRRLTAASQPVGALNTKTSASRAIREIQTRGQK
ncbi:HEAT repeat domain-containing protein [Luteolibacter arcticus]|uniref:HEAT repeat domain-containing protein n=1 Tax=Luteolibacter arcticus TaxID=1581411 RepID=A0ABT3GDH3_9BACT|nr:HEAT repeat domain-containing protein [Luteolibacter arcticus]MCW1921675.1 HEAT repeat domain-containing protein [Luteolibacter arcticus]